MCTVIVQLLIKYYGIVYKVYKYIVIYKNNNFFSKNSFIIKIKLSILSNITMLIKIICSINFKTSECIILNIKYM